MNSQNNPDSPMSLIWLQRTLVDNASEIASIADQLTGPDPSPMKDWYQTRLAYLRGETDQIISMIEEITTQDR